MRKRQISRRRALARTGLVAGTALLGKKLSLAAESSAAVAGKPGHPFLFCMNTATIRGQKLGILKEIEVTSKAGYDSIEPWMDAISEYVQKGGTLKDLKKRIEDSGLSLESAIGFPEWIVDDEARRAKGMEQAKREMDMIAQLGGKRFAAPPAGATDAPGLTLPNATERYRELLEAGDKIGIVPQLELWGFSKNLHHLGECVAVAMETGHPKACVLGDVFHLYKGGSDFHGIRLLSADAIQVLHMNDFPADVPRDKINDAQRVLPGDGTGPVLDVVKTLHKTGGQKILSLEIFNRQHWSEDPLKLARTGLGKMKAIAEKALA